ncbi:MAG: FtsX-like permease family protein [Bacteroidales bacterium]|nr:FtsX-like permease family protein [Bacteroidales bacterium]
MSTSEFIARKLRFKGKGATAAIAISFLVMIMAIAISAGFRDEIRKGISSICGDVVLTDPESNLMNGTGSIDAFPSYMDRMLGTEGVDSIRRVIYRAGIIKGAEDIQGVVFKGVSDTAALAADIPEKLSKMMKLGPGDKMTAYFVGERTKARKFTVRSVYPNPVEADGNMIVMTSLSDLQRVNGWDSTRVSALEVVLKPEKCNRKDMKDIAGELGAISSIYAREDEFPLVSTSVAENYSRIFDWLDLIDLNVLTILILMAVVAGFNMISGLLIMLFRNIPTIGTLKALGMDNKRVAAVFLRVAARTAATGMLIGNAVGLLLCAIQGRTHLVTLNPENYFISFVPVRMNVPMVLAADAGAFLVIMALLLLTTLFISRVDPAKTVRAD